MNKLRFLSTVLALAILSGGFMARGADEAPEPRSISVTAKRFEFSPSEIHLKRGETVRLQVTSADVTHGFFQRALKIDADLQPGKPADVLVTPSEAGTFTLICDHFCGAQHGNMKMTIVVE